MQSHLSETKSFRVTKKSDVHLEKAPSSMYMLSPNEEITIGDMHSNTMKFIYFLMKNDILQLDEPEDYQKLLSIYQTETDSLTKEDLQTYNHIIENKIKIKKNKSTIRLLGDEFADRGSNDYFTLKLIQRLVAEDLNLELICSNHGIEFIKVYENDFTQFEPAGFFAAQFKSLLCLGKLVEKKLIDKTEIEDFMKYFYYPNLKLISYSINESDSTFSIYSHAPVGVKTIEALATFFKIQYKDKTVIDLALTIEHINQEFSEALKKKQLYTKTFTKTVQQERLLDYTDAPLEYPIVRTIWSRGYDNELDPPVEAKNGYKIRYIHGHDGQGKVKHENEFIETNLDNVLGKSSNNIVGEYTVLVTANHHQLSREKMIEDDKSIEIKKTASLKLTENVSLETKETDDLEILKTQKLIYGNNKIKSAFDSLLAVSKNMFGECESGGISKASASLKAAWAVTVDQKIIDSKTEDADLLARLTKAIEFTHEMLSIRIDYAKQKSQTSKLFESKTISREKNRVLQNGIEKTVLDLLKNAECINNADQLYQSMESSLKEISINLTTCCGRKSKLAKVIDVIIDEHEKQGLSSRKLV